MDIDDGESNLLWVHRDTYRNDMKNQFGFGMATGAGIILLLLATFVWVYA